MDILLLGPQGSGKGTQASRIAREYGLAHVATGDMLRRAMADGTPLGRRVKPIYDAGELVPDDLMIDLIRERLAEEDTQEGFILDGFPRTMVQAAALAEEGRVDDTPEAIATRLARYHEETEPLIEHYRTTGNLVGIHADRPINDVFAEIQRTLEQVAVR